MSSLHRVHFRRLDLVDRKLPLFCWSMGVFAKDKLDTEFRVEKDDIVFRLSLGFAENLPDLYAYTDIRFDTELKVDLSVFEKEIPPMVNSGNLRIESAESVELKRAQEAERARLEEQLRDLFPLVLEALNLFRRACRVALFRESVTGRMLVRGIQATQRHWGVEVNHFLDDYFPGHDTEFLFGAFADLSLTSFTGDADIEYQVSNKLGHTQAGVFKNKYEGLRSTNRFPERFEQIQELLCRGWSVETEVLLSSLEFLYSSNYRMAVFTAATVLELLVVRFWQDMKRQLDEGNRQEQEKRYRLERTIRESGYPTTVEKILRVVLPEFVDHDFVGSGGLDRCVAAWNIRNERLAHLYAQVSAGESLEVTSTEAWDAVTGVFALFERLEKLRS